MWQGQEGAANQVDNVHFLLKQCQQGLKQWSVGLYKERHAEINRKSERLKALQDIEGPEVMKEIKKLQQDLSKLLNQEDLKWK